MPLLVLDCLNLPRRHQILNCWSKGTYTSFKGQEGLRYDDIVSKMGVEPVDMSGMDEEELKAFDLTANRIKMPGEITGRLAPGIFEADRQDAKIAIEIFPRH